LSLQVDDDIVTPNVIAFASLFILTPAVLGHMKLLSVPMLIPNPNHLSRVGHSIAERVPRNPPELRKADMGGDGIVLESDSEHLIVSSVDAPILL
jgi:hypothetical protein